MGVNYITDYNDDGSCMGQAAAEKIAFHGTTPAIQQTAPTAVGTTSAVTTALTSWGFTTSTQADAIVTAVNTLRSVLVTYGLIA